MASTTERQQELERAAGTATTYGLELDLLSPSETRERLGSKRYYGGVRDMGTGHIHPLKLLVGLARVAQAAGAALFEMTSATAIHAGSTCRRRAPTAPTSV